jgi:peptidyl-prolyl cis-trans isomerase-like protein 2
MLKGNGSGKLFTNEFTSFNEMELLDSPITNKVFTASSHIVAIRTTGNVYSYNAIEELNLRPKNFTDLIDGSRFSRADIITIQDPQNPEIMVKRDINSFKHLEQVRAENNELKKSESKLRHSLASQAVMDEIQRVQQEEAEGGSSKKSTAEILAKREIETAEDVRRFLALNPTIEDVNPGQVNTDGKAGMSLTSTTSNSWTSNAARLATPEEIREGRWRIMRKV